MNGIDIRGIQTVSMIDFPGRIASTLFLNRCNFRCPFCHNPELVFGTDTGEPVNPDEFLLYLSGKKKWIDGVCITGGEPTLHSGLADFCRKIKELGFEVKLDTNGTNSSVLKRLFDEKLLDFVAMDIKSHIDDYPRVVGVNVDSSAILESVRLIRESGVDYEFRTTVVPMFHKKDDIVRIGEWLNGSKKYVIQQFRNNTAMVDMGLAGVVPYTPGMLLEFRDAVAGCFDVCEVRGI